MGQRFGKWLVIAGPYHKGRHAGWLCRCECGAEAILGGACLRRGGSKQCRSCASKGHGLSRTIIYHRWESMMGRCYGDKRSFYKNYGGRGIKVCDEWHNPVAFVEWALANGYEENLSLDRIDNDGDYCPENCRWATLKQQARNKRTSRLIDIDGTIKTLSEWSEAAGLCRETIRRNGKAE